MEENILTIQPRKWSARDQQIFNKASKLHWYDWMEYQALEDEAESPQLKEWLHIRSTSGYHREETSAGLL